ncbi:hypothetical protein KVM15_00285 [Helicobacter pylori]|nr:hypothetical protein KVM15_00285 [Helicobacter pylori]
MVRFLLSLSSLSFSVVRFLFFSISSVFSLSSLSFSADNPVILLFSSVFSVFSLMFSLVSSVVSVGLVHFSWKLVDF